MKIVLPRSLFLVVALAVALAACSSGNTPTGSVPAPTTSAATGPAHASDNPIAPSGSPEPSPTGSVDVVSVPGGPCAGYVRPSGQTGQPGGNFIRAATTSQSQWGKPCDRLDAGDECKVGFNLSYTVMTEEAFIEFQGWTDTGTSPFVTKTIGPLPFEGQGNKWPFDVTVPKAKEVLFRLVLRDSNKVEVAISDGYVYKVGCRPVYPTSS